MSEDTPEKKVRVVDRRSFTPDGELRQPGADADRHDDAAADPEGGPGPSPAPHEAGARHLEVEPDGAGPEPEDHAPTSAEASSRPVELLDLIELLIEPAAALLTGTVPGYPKDITAARRFIDLLAVLRAKTQGNLTPDEDHLLDDALYQLHRLYVAAGR